VAEFIVPEVAMYLISALLLAIAFPSLSLIEIERLSVGIVLKGFETLVNSRIASKSGLT
jgi:hypothetical protein